MLKFRFKCPRVTTLLVIAAWLLVIGVYWWLWEAYQTLRDLWIWIFS